jgi:Lrp/AsnC family leucine-responsive transcriptional regulator
MIDSVDVQILTILQSDARTSNAAIARHVGLTPSAILERIRKLQATGVIAGYEARLDPARLGLGLTAFVSVVTDEVGGNLEAGRALAAIPEVQEVHNIAGEDCYLVKVRVKDAEALGELLRHKIGPIEKVRRTRTTIVMSSPLEAGRLPLEQALEGNGGGDGDG